ncbi:MAG: tRNA pseudouridine(55) synthase TruB [Bacteroidota bacterium]
MTETLKQHWDFRGEGEVLLVDKPSDWTSFDIVKKIRSLFKVRKVGHAGTLDPNATGLLIVCTGKQTKSIDRFVGAEKEYEGTMELGLRTPSFDAETEVTERKDSSAVTPDGLADAVSSFVGVRKQAPPMYSAAKYGGRALYRYARQGRTVERSEREIEVKSFHITRFAPPLAEFNVVCSKGTYVRSLIDELGQQLGCGAVMKSLRRLRIGEYHVDQALTVEQLIALRDRLQISSDSVYESSKTT